jgi:lipopolysaccharide transport system permease protein
MEITVPKTAGKKSTLPRELESSDDAAPTCTDVAAGEVAARHVTVIEPRLGFRFIDFAELWRFRELLFYLTLREVKVRYKQTLLGALWAVLQPFMMMVVFTVFLKRMAKVPSGDLPYPVFVYAGLLPWTFFATAIANAGHSVIGSEKMITKIYFPRLAVPFAAVGAAIIDFCIAFGVLLGMMLCYGITPGWPILLVPCVMVFTFLAALGVGSMLAALNVAYRDFRYVIPFLVQLWMFATPTIYMDANANQAKAATHASSEQGGAAANERGAETMASASGDRQLGDRNAAALPAAHQGTYGHKRAAARDGEGAVPDVLQGLLSINPLTGLIGAFRVAVLGGTLDVTRYLLSSAGAVFLFLAGCLWFRRSEDAFADII